MYITISVALSSDGYMDDIFPERLKLSNPQDFAEVDRLRRICDGILIGAETLRKDNPSLRIKSDISLDRNLTKIVISNSLDIDPESRFFTQSSAKKIIITSAKKASKKLEQLAEIIHIADPISPKDIIKQLEKKNIGDLMIEGGANILEQFLHANVIDSLRVAISPIVLGKTGNTFLDINQKQHSDLQLQHTEVVGDMTIKHYAKNTDMFFLYETLKLSQNCPISETAFSVGAVVVTNSGKIFTGYSRETGTTNHAEEEAILKAKKTGTSLVGATIYSSLEPCSTRNSKPLCCSQLIIQEGFAKVVFSEYEGTEFVQNCTGAQDMKDAGIQVLYIPLK